MQSRNLIKDLEISPCENVFQIALQLDIFLVEMTAYFFHSERRNIYELKWNSFYAVEKSHKLIFENINSIY